jgi:hypothetical protein
MTAIDDRDLDVLLAEGRCRSTIRPNTAPAYYLGRPARLWITVMHPRGKRTSPPPDVGVSRPRGMPGLGTKPITGPSSLARRCAGA